MHRCETVEFKMIFLHDHQNETADFAKRSLSDQVCPEAPVSLCLVSRRWMEESVLNTAAGRWRASGREEVRERMAGLEMTLRFHGQHKASAFRVLTAGTHRRHFLTVVNLRTRRESQRAGVCFVSVL